MKNLLLVPAFALALPIFGSVAPSSAQASDGDVAAALLGGIALGVIASELLDDDKDRYDRRHHKQYRNSHRRNQAKRYYDGDPHNPTAYRYGRHNGHGYHGHNGKYKHDGR